MEEIGRQNYPPLSLPLYLVVRVLFLHVLSLLLSILSSANYIFFLADLDVTGSPLKCPFMQADGESNVSPFTIALDVCNNKKGKVNLTYMPIPSTRAG